MQYVIKTNILRNEDNTHEGIKTMLLDNKDNITTEGGGGD